MKKTILWSVLTFGALTLQAQNMVVPNGGFFDNWSIGINGGGTMQMKGGSYFKSARPVFGMNINKQWTPILGMEIHGQGFINTSSSRTAIDASDVSLLGKMNLMNLFGGYWGEPRSMEIETVSGIGWMHNYMNGSGDSNDLTSRVGLNFNFNLGESKAWTLSFRTVVAYNLTGNSSEHKVQFNANYARVESTLGLIYHLPNSDGNHYFSMVPVCDPIQLEALNDEVNALRLLVADKDAELVATAATIAALEDQIATTPTEVDVTETVIVNSLPETIITFRQGSATIENLQMPDVEHVANFLKDNPNAKILVQGYASPEGNAEFNQKLSQNRADAIKDLLIKQYNINADRITAEGKGIGDVFPQPSWNRLSICVINMIK
jgi:outer membrane protein OmpA-like peptidoglycan-associated protein